MILLRKIRGKIASKLFKVFPRCKKRFSPELPKKGENVDIIVRGPTLRFDPETELFQGCPEGDSLSFISKKNIIRRKAYLLVTNKHFEIFVVFIIILSAVTLALETPTSDPDSYLQQILVWVDLVTTLIFFFEAILKIVAFGFMFNGAKSYLQSTENSLDFLIIIFSIMALTPLSDEFKKLKVLRIIRLINRNDGLKIAVKALLRALPNVANVTLIMLLFFLIFGVILVSQFKGTFYFCSNDIPVEDNSVNSKWDCLNNGGIWENLVYTFDDVPNALITLFTMSTTAGWQDVLYACMTSTDIDYVA